MNQVQVDAVIQAAKNICKDTYRGLTKNRQRVLEILLKAEAPISAYELKDELNQAVETVIGPMTVYRALEFLESMKLVHKLNSTNKYIACKSLTGICEHQTAIFLVCKSCQQSEKLETSVSTFQSLHGQIEAKGFSAKSSQFEVITLCNACEQKAHSNM